MASTAPSTWLRATALPIREMPWKMSLPRPGPLTKAAIAAVVNGPGLGEDIFAGLARIGGANALNLVLGGTLGIILLALLFDTFFNLLGKLTTSKGIRG